MYSVSPAPKRFQISGETVRQKRNMQADTWTRLLRLEATVITIGGGD